MSGAPVQTQKYFDALERLKAKGLPISNDAVALEAGSARSSIKKSRPSHAKLIAAIEAAALEQEQSKPEDPLPSLRADKMELMVRLDAALDREVALLSEVHDLRTEVKQLRAENDLLKRGRLVAVN